MARADRDLDFAADLKVVAGQGPRPAAHLMLWTVAALVAIGVIWADHAPLDEVTVGVGRVIPSSQTQIVQNLEGGILAEILVREGEIVKPGQVMLRIDDTTAASAYRENRIRHLALLAKSARLAAEVEGGTPRFPDELKETPQFVAEERTLYAARQSELRSALDVFARQEEQRRQELIELDNKVKHLDSRLKLAREEHEIIEPMVTRGVSSRVELLRLKRLIAELDGDLEGTRLAIPRARSALEEVRRRGEERRAAFKREAQNELIETNVRVTSLAEALTAVKDRVARTEVKSPVYGTVKQLKHNTIGGVVQPGAELVAIVPLEDNLLIEAQVRPADIAFLSPGQPAKVKITAYDYAAYGTLDGRLEHISADTIADESGNAAYQIRVRTARNQLGGVDKPLPIIPGMVAEVDILTGKKTVLDYLIRPIARAQERALRER